MPGNNDILASAGIDLKEIKAGLDELVSRVQSVEKNVSGTSNALTKFGSGFKGAAIASAITSVGAEMLQLHRRVGEVDEAFDTFRSGSIMGGTNQSAMEWSDHIRSVRDGMLRITDTVPVIGAAVRELATMGDKEAIDQQLINNELLKQAQSYDQIIAKVATLQKMQRTEQQKPGGGQSIKIAEQLANLQAQQAYNVGKQLAAGKEINVGVEHRVALEKLRQDHLKAQADLEAALPKEQGIVTAAGEKMRATMTPVIAQEFAARKRNLEMSMRAEATENQISIAAQDVSVDYNTQRQYLADQVAEKQKLITLEEKAGNGALPRTNQMRAQVVELKNQADMMDSQRTIATMTAAAQAKSAGYQSSAHPLQPAIANQKELMEREKLAEQTKQDADFAERLMKDEKFNNNENRQSILEEQMAAKSLLDLKYKMREKEYGIQAKQAEETATADEKQLAAGKLRGAQNQLELSERQKLADYAKIDAQFNADIAEATLKNKSELAAAAVRRRDAAKKMADDSEEERNFAYKQEWAQVELQTDAMQSELTVSKLLSEQARIRAQFETEIAQLEHDKNPWLAAEKRAQMATANLGAVVQAGMQTPREQVDAFRQQQAVDHEIRMENLRQKNHPNSVRADLRNHVSKSAKRAADEIAARAEGIDLAQPKEDAFAKAGGHMEPFKFKNLPEKIRAQVPNNAKADQALRLQSMNAANLFVKSFALGP